MTLFDLLNEFIPNDHSRQFYAELYIPQLLKMIDRDEIKVLDLGCGAGNSFTEFFKYGKGIQWTGIDVEGSPEMNSQNFIRNNIVTFDGINIPFENNSFDLIYSRQVLEHVRYPQKLIAEAGRVLKPGGFFFGSTSHLEPYHSLSLWNYTPYGFKELLMETNLSLIELRPSIDAITLILRRGLGSPKIFNVFWKYESPLNLLITLLGKITGMKNKKINLIKLLFCGQFCFLIKKISSGKNAA